MTNTTRFGAVALAILLLPLVSCVRRGMTEAQFPRKVGHVYSPSWSPDGRSIAAVGKGASTVQDLLVYDVATEETTFVLTHEDGFLSSSVDWSPVQGMLAASAGPHEGPDGIWAVRVEDPQPSYIAPGQDASWSPDGTRLAIIDDYNDGPALKIVDVDSGSVITSFGFEETDVASPTLWAVEWARSKDVVALVASNVPSIGSNTYGIYTVDLKTRAVSRAPLDGGVSVGSGLAWSLDDNWILFTLGKGEGVAAVSIAEGCLVRLLPGVESAWDLDLAPDGNRLAVETNTGLVIADISQSMAAPLAELLECP